MEKTILNNKSGIALLIMLFFFGLFFFLDNLASNKCNDILINNIKKKFSGVILKKIALRDNLTTHALIRMENGKDTLIFLNKIENISLGDSIYKPINSPYYYYVNKGKKYREVFEYIPKDCLNNNNFSDSWKEKSKNEWQEAVK